MTRMIDADALYEAVSDHVTTVSVCPTVDWARGKSQMKEICLEDIANAPTVGGWISVKDRLPDTYKSVITYDKYSGVSENWLLRSRPCVSWSQGFHVTHWMPLPEPPKEET